MNVKTDFIFKFALIYTNLHLDKIYTIYLKLLIFPTRKLRQLRKKLIFSSNYC